MSLKTEKLIAKLFSEKPFDFDSVALEIFRYQAENLLVYRNYLTYLDIESSKITNVLEIPFLPISFYKSYKVLVKGENEKKVFRSSGTTNTDIANRSSLYLSDEAIYQKSALQNFERFFGKINTLEIFALLPSYSEREDSSLVYMVNDFMTRTTGKKKNFFLDNWDALVVEMKRLDKRKIVLFAVSFALLDFAESGRVCDLPISIIETGGMKGRKKEMIKEELFLSIRTAFPNAYFHSEYGMTELLSQAYAKDGHLFSPPKWMRAFVREAEDPFALKKHGNGVLNIIDLAAINNCSFIATEDLAILQEDGDFSILGRLDKSDVRGCSQLVL